MLVGRTTELDLLATAIASRHGSSTVAVTGPAGIGKTSLCEAAAQRAREEGSLVTWGRAWEFGGAPPFFPWSRAFAGLAEGAPGHAGALEPISAWLREGAGDQDVRSRVSLFDHARATLADISRHRPIVLVLDDMHAADPDSLQLGRYLQRELAEARVAIVLTLREADAESAAAAARGLLLDLVQHATRTLTLGGLTEAAVEEWLPWFAGRSTPDGLARKLVQLTDGNPFFVRELVEAERRDLEAILEGRMTVPRGVREVLRRQVALLGPDTQEALRVASVSGRSCELSVLARVLSRTVAEVGALLQPAIEARLLRRGAPARHQFAHALIADALYSELTPAHRVELHAAFAQALPDTELSERARHAVLSATLGPSERTSALRLSLQAGAQAQKRLAFEEAARHFGDAVALARDGGDSPRDAAEANLGLGEALAAAGDRSAAAAAFTLAFRLAGELDDPALIARSAIGCASTREYMRRDPDKLALLERAFERLSGEDDSDVKARLMARLANDLTMSEGARARRVAVATSAVAAARRVGTSETLALALEAQLQAAYTPDSIEQRLVTADEILAHARSRGDRDREIAGLGWKLSALLERGDVLVARPLAAEHARLAEERRLPGPRINARSRLATLALMAGELETAIRLAREAWEIGKQASDDASDLLYRAQLVVPCELLGAQERIAEGLPTLVQDGAHQIHAFAIKALLARSLLALGRRGEGAAEIAALGAQGFVDVPDDFVRVGTLATLADGVAAIRDADAALGLLERLAPYATHNAMIGTATSLGAVSRYLGLLAATAGRDEEAEAWLRAACLQNRAMEARPWTAWSEHDLAEVLARRGALAEAEALRGSARETARSLRLSPLLARLEAHEPAPGVAKPRPAPRSATLERSGARWSLTLDAQTWTLPDRRGMAMIARLVTTPGEEVHALELISGSAQAPREAQPGAVLDARAKAELGGRLRDLRGALAEAEADGDTRAAQRARAELEALEEELSSALGLGGRSRKHGSAAERGRVAVTIAIRRTIETISAQSPEVAAHLGRSVKTGLFCSYDPDPASSLRVTT